MNEGFFVAVFADGTERVAFKCEQCRVQFVFAPEDPARVNHCNHVSVYKKQTGWFAPKLERVQMSTRKRVEVPRRDFDEVGEDQWREI